MFVTGKACYAFFPYTYLKLKCFRSCQEHIPLLKSESHIPLLDIQLHVPLLRRFSILYIQRRPKRMGMLSRIQSGLHGIYVTVIAQITQVNWSSMQLFCGENCIIFSRFRNQWPCRAVKVVLVLPLYDNNQANHAFLTMLGDNFQLGRNREVSTQRKQEDLIPTEQVCYPTLDYQRFLCFFTCFILIFLTCTFQLTVF